MDTNEHTHNDYRMENFVNCNINKLNKMTSMDIVHDPILQFLFKEFVQRGHSIKTEPTLYIERFLLCDKIIKYPTLLNNKCTMNKLIEKCSTYESEIRLRDLANRGIEPLNHLYELERYKYETLIDLICHEDYKRFLTAVKNKSRLIKEILEFIYGDFYEPSTPREH